MLQAFKVRFKAALEHVAASPCSQPSNSYNCDQSEIHFSSDPSPIVDSTEAVKTPTVERKVRLKH